MSLCHFLRDLWHAIRPPAAPARPRCVCDPQHLEIGSYDPGCPVHDPRR